MLKCILCNREYPEQKNFTNDGCHKNPLFTTLYSTKFPTTKFFETPLEVGIGEPYTGIWLKREDENRESGCFKDRKSIFVRDNSEPTQKFALASCGNQAISFMKCDSLTALHTALYLPKDVQTEKLKMLQHGFESITFTDKILSGKELSESNYRWNFTNGMDPIGASAIYSLGLELESENFDNIVVPLGSGELYSMLSVYFKILRNKKVNIIPVKTNHPLADAIKTKFVPMTPFIEHFGREPIIVSSVDNILRHAEYFNCEFSSAVVFEAAKYISGKSVFVITGAKR